MYNQFGYPFDFTPGVNSFVKIDASNPRVMEVYDDFPQ